MAMRRRIKVGVNLSAAKRKPKSEPDQTSKETEENSLPLPQVKSEEPQNDTTTKQPETQEIKIVPKSEPTTEIQSDDAAFKFPPKVDFNRSNSNTTTNNDDLNHSDIEMDGAQVMQMDLQRTASGFPISPSKAQRQRIRPTPIFGQRRNSLIGLPPSPLSLASDDSTEPSSSPHKRERHYSGSQNCVPTVSSSTNKATSHGTGRIRTESNCSIFSDSHTSTTSKSRKVDDHNAQRTQSRRDFEARFSNGIPDKSNLKMFDLIYYNPVTNPMEKKTKIEEIKKETKEEDPDNDADFTSNDKSALPVPQLKLNAKGELILDDKSLEIETTAEQEARKVLAKSSLIYLDENTGMNGFYKRQKRTRDWAPEETIRFYRCLQTIGTDFSMMCQLFPKRTRRDIKLKFKKEERCNGALINKALLHPNLFNIQELKDQFEFEDRQREEEEQKRQANKQIQYKKVNIKTSKSARALKNADDIYNQELRELEVKKPKNQRKLKSSNKNETLETVIKESSKKKRQIKKTGDQKDKVSSLVENSAINLMVKDEQEFLAEVKSSTPPNRSPLTMQTEIEVQNDDSCYTRDDPISAENRCIEFLTNDTIEYDPAERFQYLSDSDESQNENEFEIETADPDSRTLVNMDSGNVTHVKDFQTMNNNMDEHNVRLIDKAEIMGSNFTALSSMSMHDDQNSLFGLNEYEQEKCTPKSENVSTEKPNFLKEFSTLTQFPDTTEFISKREFENLNVKSTPTPLSDIPQYPNQQYQNGPTIQDKNRSMTLSSTQSSDRSDNVRSCLSAKSSPRSENCSTREPIQSHVTANDEAEIQKILENIANGSLVVVSTINPVSLDEPCNEIYMLNPNTGELCEEPLELPQELIQSILSVMT